MKKASQTKEELIERGYERIERGYERRMASSFLATMAGVVMGVCMIGEGYKTVVQENIPSKPDEVLLYEQTTEDLAANLRGPDHGNLSSRIDEDSSKGLRSDPSYDIFSLERRQSRLEGSGAFINYEQSLSDYNNKIDKGAKFVMFGFGVMLLFPFCGYHTGEYLKV